MKIYWYWPHPHRVASPLALATLRPEDTLTVQALPSLHGESFAPVEEYEVVRTLPDPTVASSSSISRAFRKPRIALRRALSRRAVLRDGFDIVHLEVLTYQTDWFDLRGLARRSSLVSNVHDVRPHRSSLPAPVESRHAAACLSGRWRSDRVPPHVTRRVGVRLRGGRRPRARRPGSAGRDRPPPATSDEQR